MPTLVGRLRSSPDRSPRRRGACAAAATTKLEIYSPAPFPEVDDALDEKPSRVRLFTLIGGLLGVVTGYALTIWMANDWPIMVGGKPFSSVAPYTIIALRAHHPVRRAR